ncbi:MAG: hypothetical protein C6I00_00910 [Nitratiruptor sp.]|nr:hypothetical protein [Nitratiruptor sp.]NPA83430.1 DUF481 domain-containing protein [Campylobacterota bacterium]
MRPAKVLGLLLLPLLGATHKVELGYFGTTGNTNITSLTAAYRLQYPLKSGDKIHLRGDVLYSTRRGKKSGERYRLHLDYTHALSSTTYTVTGLSFLRNVFGGYNQQYNLSLALGYRLQDRTKQRFDLLVGYLFRRDNYTRGGSDNFNYLKGELKYRYRLTKRNTFKTRLSFIENMERSQDFESQWVSALSIWIVDAFHLKVSFELKYDHLPPPSKKRVDTITKGTIVYSF